MAEVHENEFNKLALDNMAAIYSTAIRLTGNTSMAEDLVHRTYFLAFNIFHTYHRKANFEGWITDICRKIHRNYSSIDSIQHPLYHNSIANAA